MLNKKITLCLLRAIPALIFFAGIIISYIVVMPPIERTNPIRKALRSMPEEDWLALDAFFRILIFKSSFGYTLYGDKPMSLVDYIGEYSDKVTDYGGIRYSHLSIANAILREGWLVWKKYCHLFPSRNYILHQFGKKNDSSVFILLINRKAFENAFVENHQEFVLRYGSDITAKTMLEKCLSEESLFSKDFKHYHELKGILFGFGSHNAQLFQKREDLT